MTVVQRSIDLMIARFKAETLRPPDRSFPLPAIAAVKTVALSAFVALIPKLEDELAGR